MSFEMVVGLNVKDDALYASYRDAMTPILVKFGGGFRYDFVVSQVLKNDERRPINRVFTIHFENKDSMEKFFSDPEYVSAKEMFFEKSVGDTTIISQYER
ncbi:MAG: DUF1330 domain-containing protein [Pseudobacteriovorax sp.]|nr:DUF1330 domain-containing protein [Pseudobacteriovorax sp.]